MTNEELAEKIIFDLDQIATEACETDTVDYLSTAMTHITALISEYVSAKDEEIERLENDIKISDKKTQILYDTKDERIAELSKALETIKIHPANIMCDRCKQVRVIARTALKQGE